MAMPEGSCLTLSLNSQAYGMLLSFTLSKLLPKEARGNLARQRRFFLDAFILTRSLRSRKVEPPFLYSSLLPMRAIQQSLPRISG